MTDTARWLILAFDEGDPTVDAYGDDPEELADKVASWAQWEADHVPHLGLIYMLVPIEDMR